MLPPFRPNTNTEQGIYDFQTFEEKNQLARWRQEGKRVVFRFVADIPSEELHMDIPDWLYAAMNENGDYYDNEYGMGFSPDYSDPVFIDNHKLAIAALGRRYGMDDFFAFVELGSLGHWGEWHVNSDIRSFPEESIRDLYVAQYSEAFPNTHLLMRRPFSIARLRNLGLYNDMIGDLESTTTWLDWIEFGGEYSQTGEPNGLVPMSDGWKVAPIGGEQAPSISNEKFYDEALDQTIDLIRESHTTFIGPNGPYTIEKGGSLQKGVDQVLSVLGYRIYIEQVQMPRWILFEKNIYAQITFGNSGIAPMYYDWPTKVYLLNDRGEIVIDSQMDMNVRKVIPGENYQVSVVLPVKNLTTGVYSIGVAIIDPHNEQPAIQLAMKTTRQDLIYELGSFTVIRLPLLIN